MSKHNHNLKIGLLENGAHSLKRGYEMWAKWKKNEDAWLLKESVIWVHHGIELLLKELLVQTNEFLLFQDLNKAVEKLGKLRKNQGKADAGVLDLFESDESINSVGFKQLIERVAIALSIPELATGPLRDDINELTKYRNKIVHFSIELDAFKISNQIYKILDPLLYLLAREIQDIKFKKETIPEIRKLAQPVQLYLDYIRNEIVKSAVSSTISALPPSGNGKAGVFIQASGSGLSTSLQLYLQSITKENHFNKTQIIILTDRKDTSSQLYSNLSSNGHILTAYPSTKDELAQKIKSKSSPVIITTIQMLKTEALERDSQYLIIGYNLHRLGKRYLESNQPLTKILFTSTPSNLLNEYFGETIEEYNLSDTINDGISNNIFIEEVKLKDSALISKSYEYNHGFNIDRLSKKDEELIYFEISNRIFEHFNELRKNKNTKAIVIVKNLDIANCICNHLLKFSPSFHNTNNISDVVSVISSNQPQQLKNNLLFDLNNTESPLSLLIGTGSFLSGYDNRSVSTIYITCPISHQLQYRLASVASSTHPNKSEGRIVDFIGHNWSL